jgi:hypothetical protein
MRWALQKPWRVDFVGTNLRKSDDLECRFAYGISGREALHNSVAASEIVRCICADDGEPLAVAGVNGSVIWLLGTNGLTSTTGRRRALAIGGRRWVDQLAWERRTGAALENWVFAGNVESVRWLRSMGFTVETPRPMGPSAQLFHHAWRISGI